jgi:hypothetical protein
MKLSFTCIFLLLASMAFGQSFVPLNSSTTGGSIRSIKIDPSTGKIYAISAWEPKALVSSDGGATWSSFGPSTMRIYDLVIDGTTFYASDYSTFYKSDNGGTSFTRVNKNTSFQQGNHVRKLPVGNAFVAWGCEGVFVSGDGGVAWKKISGTALCGLSDFNVAITSNGDVYFTSPYVGLMRHPFAADGAWSDTKVSVVYAKEVSSTDNNVSVAVNNSDKIFYVTRNASTLNWEIKTSTTGSTGSFTLMAGPPSTSLGLIRWTTSPNNKVHIADLNTKTFWELTSESPVTWTQKKYPNANYSDYNVNTFAWKSNTEVYAATDGSGVFKSTSTATTDWLISNGTLPNAISSPYASDIEILADGTLVVKEDNGTKGVWTSTDRANLTFQQKSFLMHGPRWGQKLVKLQDNSLVCQTSLGLQRTTNGVDWTLQAPDIYGAVIPVGTNEIYNLRENGKMYVSPNLGVAWTEKSVTGFPTNFGIMYLTYLGGDFFAAINNNTTNKTEYYKIETSGSPWLATNMNAPLRTDSYSCTGLFELNNKLYISDGKVIGISPDQGSNWSTITYNNDVMLPIRDGLGGIGLGVRGTVLITQDDGKTWRNIAAPDALASIRDIAQFGSDFYAVFQGGAVAKYSGNLILPAAQLPPVINFNWQALAGGPFEGRGVKIVKSPGGQLYAIGVHGFFRFNSALSKWEHIIINGHVYSTDDIIVNSAGKIFITDNYNLFYSTDNGTTWTRSTTSMPNSIRLGIAGNGNIVVCSGDGLYVSANGGVSFSQPATATTGEWRSIATASNGTMFASRKSGSDVNLWKSVDNGASWTQLSAPTLTGKEVLSLQPLEAGAVGLVTNDDILKTVNDGAAWSSIKGNLTTLTTDVWSKEYSKLFVSGSGEYYFINQASVFSSASNGTTWTKKSDLSGVSHLVFAGTSLYASSSTYGIQVSTDGGTTFSSAAGKGFASYYGDNIILSQGNIIFSGGGSGRVHYSADKGETFSLAPTNIYSDFILRLSKSIITFGGGISKSTDNGVSWTKINYAGNYISKMCTPDELAYYALRDSKFIKSTDLVSWTEITASNPTNYYVVSIAADKSGNIYYTVYNDVSGRHELYKIQFGNTVLVDQLSDARSVRFSDDKLFVYCSNGQLFESTDGETWTKRSAPPDASTLHVTQNNYFFLSNENTGDLWLSRDQANSWQNVGGLSSDRFQSMDIDLTTGYAYAGVENRGVQKSSVPIIPNDNTAPVISSTKPVNTQDNLQLTEFAMVINFNESVKGVTGKKVRLFKSTDATTPVEIFDATTGTFSQNNSVITLTPAPTSIKYGTHYFVVIDNGAYTDIFGNAFAGITSNTGWSFTTMPEPDLIGPTFPGSFNATPLDKSLTTAKTFEIQVADNNQVNSSEVDFMYRPLNSDINATFTAAAMTETGTAGIYSVTLQSSWYGEVGLEFFFQAKDMTGNVGRTPADPDYYYSYIKYSEDSRPKIKGLTFGETATNYKIIAVPLDLIDNSIATIFDEKGTTSKESWRMATYSGDGYDEFPGGLTSVSRGKGYWFLQRAFTDIFLENATVPSNNRNNFFKITLQAGWNMVGNPYPFPIRWSEVMAANAGKNIGQFKRYLNGSYSNADGEIAAYEGGWVLNSTTAPVEISIAFGDDGGGRHRTVSSDLSKEHWEVPLYFSQGMLLNNIGGIGMHAEASEAVDVFDDFNPPSYTNRFDIEFENGTVQRHIGKSIVPRAESFAWKFTANTDDPAFAEITWDNTTFGPNDIDLFLLDEETQQLTDMRSTDRYGFSGSRQRSFTLFYGQDLRHEVKPSISLLGNPYPNPSKGLTNIAFTVSESSGNAHVSLDIYNMHGERVTSLVNRPMRPGFYNMEWNADNAGNAFICRMVITDAKGRSISQLKKIIITE